MGFMTWELFRCGARNGADDDGSDPLTTYQISSALLRGQAQAMSQRGFAAAGYTLLSIDDVRLLYGAVPHADCPPPSPCTLSATPL